MGPFCLRRPVRFEGIAFTAYVVGCMLYNMPARLCTYCAHVERTSKKTSEETITFLERTLSVYLNCYHPWLGFYLCKFAPGSTVLVLLWGRVKKRYRLKGVSKASWICWYDSGVHKGLSKPFCTCSEARAYWAKAKQHVLSD